MIGSENDRLGETLGLFRKRVDPDGKHAGPAGAGGDRWRAVIYPSGQLRKADRIISRQQPSRRPANLPRRCVTT